MSYALSAVRHAAGGRWLVRDVDLAVQRGRVTVLAGPNGAGKSTALKLLTGDLRPTSGTVSLNGRPLDAWSAREQAVQRAVLTQDPRLDFPFAVEEVVTLGRGVHRGRSRRADDERAIARAMALAGVAPLAGRIHTTLSGGERQRVQLARVVAQIADPPASGLDRYLLLDEPTSSLDIAHQGSVMAAARALAAEGVGVLAVLHDLNLAAAFADDLVVMREGRIVASGAPEVVLTAETIGDVYGVPVRVERHESLDRMVVLPVH